MPIMDREASWEVILPVGWAPQFGPSNRALDLVKKRVTLITSDVTLRLDL